MTKYAIILSALWLLLGLCSCTNYRDNNGDLGGMWQLTMWQTRSSSNQIDSVVATNEQGIYYSIHRDIIQLTCTGQQVPMYGDRLFAYFRHTPDSLILYNIICKNDSLPTAEATHMFGLPADGAFHIDALSGSHMVLSNTDNILTFRKY